MRTDTITIGGKPYPVKGLTVNQALLTDLESFDARAKNDNKALTDVRVRRLAYGLQNGQAYIPDQSSPKDPVTGEHKGQICAASMSTDNVMKWLDSDVFSDMVEFYAAERANTALASPAPALVVVKPVGQEAKDGPGEQAATESPTITSEISVA